MVADDFKNLLPAREAAAPVEDDRPIEVLWVYDPQEDRVHLADGEGDHPAHFPFHEDIAPDAHHPDRMEGYAFSIDGGWRIMTKDFKPIDDPHVVKWVMRALRHEHSEPLPRIRYHGDPGKDPKDPERLGSTQ